jgi:hypothetical protein
MPDSSRHGETSRDKRVRIRAALALATTLVGCLGDPAPEDLRQGASVIGSMAAPRHLRQSMFLGLFPSGKPSQFVSFLFSTLGTAEWPESERSAARDPILGEEAAAIGIPLLPDGVAFTDRSPKSELGRQIVVRFDDPRNLLIIEGYVDPTQPPVLTVEREFRVPTLRPHETLLLRRIAESNLELGASAQAF